MNNTKTKMLLIISAAAVICTAAAAVLLSVGRGKKKMIGSIYPKVSSFETKRGTYRPEGGIYFGNAGEDVYKDTVCGVIGDLFKEGITDDETKAGIVFEKDESMTVCGEYRLTVTKKGLRAEYKDGAGAFYAAQTAAQLTKEGKGKMPCCIINDRPDTEIRGYSLDMARDRVLTLDSLKQLVDDISAMKMNLLMVYLELPSSVDLTEEECRVPGTEYTLTTFGTGLTTEELREFDEYARRHYVEAVPFIETVAHLWSLLQYPQYESMKEIPGYCSTIAMQNPDAQKVMRRWIDIVTGCFKGDYVMIGGDEAGEIGKGQSIKNGYVSHITGEPLQLRGDVFLDSICIVYDMVKENKPDAKVLAWHDMMVSCCSLNTLRKASERMPDMIPCIWGYEAGDGEYDADTDYFNYIEGWDYWICPSTNSFTSITGRLTRCERNVGHAADAFKANDKAKGLLITNWGDGGQKERLTAEYTGLAYAAGYFWDNSTAPAEAYEYAGKNIFGESTGKFMDAWLSLQRENDLFTHSWGCGWLGKVGSEGYTGIDLLCAFVYYQTARGNERSSTITLDETVESVKEIINRAEKVKKVLGKVTFNTENGEILMAEAELTADMTVYYAEYLLMRLELLKPYYDEAYEFFGDRLTGDMIGEAAFTAKIRELMGADTLEDMTEKAAASLGKSKEDFRKKAAEMSDFSKSLYEKYTEVWYMANKKGGFDESIGTLKGPGALFEAMK